MPILFRSQILVDPCDEYLLFKYSWYLDNGYARARMEDGKLKFLHNVIFPELKRIDHRDGNRLNCRRSNLREATQSQNMQNIGKRLSKLTPYKGVYPVKDRWVAKIRANATNLHLGTFDSAEDAARAYNTAALKYHGEFAFLNKIQE